MGRNRSTGWQHAKLSGHENESDVEKPNKQEKSIVGIGIKKRRYQTAFVLPQGLHHIF